MSTPNEAAGAERIVVGIDGSPSSKAALAWAAQQAALTGAPLTVVSTWHYPNDYGYVSWLPDNVDFSDDARAVIDQTITEVLGDETKIEVTRLVVQDHPALALVEESKSAALVVVGSRGHGEFAGMLLGSVSEFIATHAHCPVVIVRGEAEL
jgi:nucleotide-binding universal stress UspA family protein